MKTISERLKFYRTRKKISLAEAARRIGVAESTYRDWEKGRLIQGEPYSAICKAFGISLQQIFYCQDEQSSTPQLIEEAINILQKIQSTL